ncbi:MAG: TolC family protein [Bacteroidota bacterium]
MQKLTRILPLVFLLLATEMSLFAQVNDRRELTLERCIRLAQRQSPEANIARKTFESAYWSFKSFRAGLLPQVRLDADLPGLVRSFIPNTLDDGSITFSSQNVASSSATLSINQTFAPTGASIYLRSRLNRQDVFGTNASTIYRSTPFVVGVRQPLFGYNSLRWDRQIQPLQYTLAEKRYLESLEDIAIDITGKYFDIYIAEIRLVNALTNASINDSIFTIAKGRFNVGKIAENDLLQTELAYLNAIAAERQAEVALEKAQTELAISLGMSDPRSIGVRPPLDIPQVEIDADFALAQARENRSDMVDYQVRGLEAESNVARVRSENRFNANILAEFGLNQVGNTLTEVYSNPQDQQTATVGIGIPLLQWGRGKAAVESALISQDRIREQIKLDNRRLERDVRFQVLDFLQLQQQTRLSAKADTIAQRRYEVAKNRYLIGKIDITNLQIAQTEKDNARSTYIQALKQFWVAYYRLRRSTLYDFIEDALIVTPEF